MNRKQGISSLIYEYLLARFQFRYYRRGDTLPTVDSLCRELSVAPKTVLTALRRLRMEGYISMHNGCSTRVLFEQSDADYRLFSLRFFSERWESFADLFSCCELIIVPMLAEAVCRMDAKDCAYLSQLAQRAKVEDLMLFYCYTLQKLNNPLAMNLYWETSIFLGFPFMSGKGGSSLYDETFIRAQLLQIVSCAKARDSKTAHGLFLTLQHGTTQRFTAIIEPYIQPVAEDGKASFTWRIYRERPQYCYSLAIRILHDIHWGEFRGLEFLPSYEKTAEKYGVSVITVRRTVALLNEFGAVRSVNGKGTRIYPLGQRLEGPDFSSKGVRRNLAFFIQAFEIAAYSCEGVFKAFFASQTPTQHNALLFGLEGDSRAGRYHLSLWRLLIALASDTASPVLREIYGKLYGLFLWGYPLKIDDTPSFDSLAQRFCLDLIRFLRENDFERSAAAVKSLMENAFPIATRHLLQHGFSPEELRLSASLKLFIT